jgi:guanylate kinase
MPIVIMGESGVGKTALIKYLVEIIMKNKFLLFNVHAGIY